MRGNWTGKDQYHEQAFLELIDRRQPAFDRRLCVHVLIHIHEFLEKIYNHGRQPRGRRSRSSSG